MENEEIEVGKIVFYIIVALLCFVVVIFGIRSAFLIGNTYMERKAFENSYQKQEALKSQIALYEATLEEIELKLHNSNLDDNTRANLNAQKSAITIKMKAAIRRLK